MDATLAVMNAGRDFLLVLSGKTASNEQMARDVLGAKKLNFKRITLNYDIKMMQKEGHIGVMRGVFNAGAIEFAFNMPRANSRAKVRLHVDPGSHMYMDTMNNVPVACQTDVLTVGLQTLEEMGAFLSTDKKADDTDDTDDNHGEEGVVTRKKNIQNAIGVERFSGNLRLKSSHLFHWTCRRLSCKSGATSSNHAGCC